MNSSQKPAKVDEPEVVLVREGGVSRLPAPHDPIAAWMDLMEVVEALRPRGRKRPVPRVAGRYLL